MIMSSGGISPWHTLTERARGFFIPLPLVQSSKVNKVLYGEAPPRGSNPCPLNTEQTYRRKAEVFSLSNPKGCQWRYLIGSLARPKGTCFRVEHSCITHKIGSQ